MLAVDPSSRRSGGSLLGDRARIEFDPADRGIFIRSTSAGERLGGLAWATRAAAHALAAAFDVVVIETVGVGQGETEVADVADTVAVVVQPGSGDVLQFLKSGITEIPDVLVVTKADLRDIAVQTKRDVSCRDALGSAPGRRASWPVSSLPPRAAASTSSSPRSRSTGPGRGHSDRRLHARRANALTDYIVEHGERGLRTIGGRRAAPSGCSMSREPDLDTAGARGRTQRHAGPNDGARRAMRRGGRCTKVGRDLAMIFREAFVAASALAGALGAANLGTALAFGQIAFAASVVYVMLRR